MQDEQGIYFIDKSNKGFPLLRTQRQDLRLNDVLPAFTEPLAPEKLPQCTFAEAFVDQIQPEACLTGQAPLISLRVTNVADGFVLGVSASHTFTGEHTRQALLPTLLIIFECFLRMYCKVMFLEIRPLLAGRSVDY